MLSFSYDLHIHSCLSPCGDNDMTPSNIVGMAMIKGVDIIALTDHNSCKNCAPFLEAANFYGITAIPGMELTTEEEVHVICLFPNLEKAMAWDEYVYNKIIPITNNPTIFGEQRIVDSDDNLIAQEALLLINATSISFQEVFELVQDFGGIAFPAHIEKGANSLFSNLGFIPPDSKFTCVEVKNLEKLTQLCEDNQYIKGCRVITNSDAHYLQDINEPINFLHSKSKAIEDIFNAIITKSNT